MPTSKRLSAAGLFVLSLLAAWPSAAAQRAGGPLVDVEWLASRLGSPDLLLLDASPGPVHAARHIPGAIGVDFLTYGFPERPVADMEQRYQSWGISPGRTVVVYDQGGTFFATRLLFALYHHGFPAQDLYLLDGGLAKWEAMGRPVTKEPTPAPPRGTFRVTAVNEDVRVRLPEFLAASGDPAGHVLVEGLGPDWHFGETAFFGRAGHVPHAVMLPATDFFNADKTFKSADDIRRMVAYLGIGPERRVHTYCGGGLAASVPFFALKFLLGFPKVTLFQESLMGWVSDSRDLPLWTYDAPAMLRGADWLQSWAGARLRAFRSPDISIVDVRPAAAFDRAHVPFAVNIGADVFRTQLASPGQLASALAEKGVAPSHEAVIVSGAGLTRDSAIALLAFHRIGHDRVSILLDSMEQWAQRGFPLQTPQAAGATPPAAAAAPPRPVPYPVTPREGVVVADARGTRGRFPTVFVASGDRMPDARPDGTVVHVPSASLLDAAGAPRPAKDIWAALSKAGVPRYAELICYADDPGDAAVNYVVLKLMGFPDVKVLAPTPAVAAAAGH